MECKPEFKTLVSRLEAYGLADREKQLVDITVEAGQHFTLTIEDPQLEKFIVNLRPQSPYDLKKWIGIPDSAVRSWPQPAHAGMPSASQAVTEACSVFIPQPRIVPGDLEMQTNFSSFLFRNTSAITQHELSALAKFIDRLKIQISIFLARDINVAAGAQLIVGSKIQLLWARYITVATTGQIKFQGPFGKIDCAGLRSRVPFVTVGTAAEHAAAIR